MNWKLGAIPLSSDILTKANIGLWAFELDEGKEPRMYVNEAMLGLIGLEQQISPEETYHAWFDHIDEGSYDLVAKSVEKMTAGEHAEVQYPWHHPNGETWIVRCGGVRNFDYTAGVRIEGTHQNVTDVIHFQEDKLKENRILINYFLQSFSSAYSVNLAEDSFEILHMANDFSEVFTMGGNRDDMKRFIAEHVHPDDREMILQIIDKEYVAERLRKEDNFTFTLREIYGGQERTMRGVIVRGIDEYHVAVGFMDITETLRKEKEQREKLAEAARNNRFIDAMVQHYATVYVVDMAKDSYRVIKAKDDIHNRYAGSNYSSAMKKYILGDVLDEDRELMLTETDYDRIRSRVSKEATYIVRYRAYVGGEALWHEMSVILTGQPDVVIMGMKARDTEILMDKARDSLFNNYLGIYIVELNSNNMKILKGTGGFEKYEGKVVPWRETMRTFSESLKGEDRAFFRDVYGNPEATRAILRKENDMEYFYRSPNYGGGHVWMKSEVHTILHNANGEPELAMVGISSVDSQQREKMHMNELIAEQKVQLEEQQEQLAHALSMAESANRAKTTFLNNMSHDIRTPMNAIIGYTGLAASHIDNKQQVQAYLSKIAQSSDHLLSLINDVLDMSRIESGKMNLCEKEENLPEIIHTLRDIVQADMKAKQHDFFIDTVNVNDDDIICDKLRLNQVLLNILSNSIKYTSTGGTIAMRITEKTVKPNGYAVYEFRIKDNGMGMEPEFVETIFEPFTRVKSSTVSGIQGTGLGMAITKNIVDMMGGSIEISSEPGKGTETVVTFDFKLQESHKEAIAIPELQGFRGLVVDDDANTCLSVSDMLKDIGMRYEWCTSGKEAVIRAEAAYRTGDSFRVYIIDWLMPDMNGIETVRRIRRVIGDDAPIIILTAYDWSDIAEEARQAGVTEFVNKPLFPSDLHRVLSRLLGREEETGESSAAEFDFTGRKILLVEDNALNLEIAEEILADAGFIVDTADDGTVAVEKIKNAQPGDYDLVLMDIQMPVMDGYEATRQIRELGTEASNVPIIAMTANAFEEDRQAAFAAGMNEHIAKPIDLEKLKKTLVSFLAN